METCRVTLVQPGLSDSVIKIYPAEHKEEKIWLTEVKGIERWDMIKRNMNAFAERGTRVPNPIPYHADPKNLVHVTLKEEDVPLVKLDGWVLPAPPPEPKMPEYKNDPSNMLDINKRIGDLEKMVGSMAQALSVALNVRPPEITETVKVQVNEPAAEPKKRGRPRKAVAQEA